MSNDAYHKADGISKSKTDAIAPECGNSPRHYYATHVNPARPPFVPTAAMVIGTAIHAAILEPDEFANGYIIVPDDAPKRPSAAQLKAEKPSGSSISAMAYWADFSASAAGRVILSSEDWTNIIGARDAVLTHPDIKGLFDHGAPEQTYFAIDPETGALIKCRPDYDRVAWDAMVVDIKSTDDASDDGFGGSATKYRYDVQDPWYCDVIDAALGGRRLVENFAFVAVESKPPHAVGLYYLRPADKIAGRMMARRDLRRILDCTAANYWPDFVGARGAQPLRIRPHARREIAA